MYEAPYPPGYELDSTNTILLWEWLCHYITYKGWYAIKQRNQRKINVIWARKMFSNIWLDFILGFQK